MEVTEHQVLVTQCPHCQSKLLLWFEIKDGKIFLTIFSALLTIGSLVRIFLSNFTGYWL